jgi:hypothetical protein
VTSEYRIIEFDHVELAGALAAHSIAQGTHIVVGSPKSLNIDVEKVSVTATWAPTKKRPETRISYIDSEICQALIRHCKTLGIPLPSASKKNVRVLNGRITMLVELVRHPTSPLVPLEYQPESLSQDAS